MRNVELLNPDYPYPAALGSSEWKLFSCELLVMPIRCDACGAVSENTSMFFHYMHLSNGTKRASMLQHAPPPRGIPLRIKRTSGSSIPVCTSCAVPVTLEECPELWGEILEWEDTLARKASEARAATSPSERKAKPPKPQVSLDDL